MYFKRKGLCSFCGDHRGIWRANQEGFSKDKSVGLVCVILRKIFACSFCYTKIQRIQIALRQTSKSLSLISISDECIRQDLIPRPQYVETIILKEYDKI